MFSARLLFFAFFKACLTSSATPLDLPLSQNLTAPNPSPSYPYPVYCYTQPAPPSPQLPHALHTDCYILARRLVRRIPHPEVQQRWSHDPTRGLRVPKIFKEKTCVFEVTLPDEARGGWEASFTDIAFASNEVNALCVWDGVHLGGKTKVGKKGKLDLLVYGERWDPPEPPEDISLARR
ncbi:MAG: hypothetical protein L6R37_000129 [Teloschistes peruensis]|nr:MAG: hypothetical protein L6R37_000129 [Teloschistes peruensis]